jgi:hypothetical protein
MAVKEIEIVVRGGRGSSTCSAAQAAAQLEAEGASVDLRTVLAAEELAPGALRGVRVLVRVEKVPAPWASLPAMSGRSAGSSGARPGLGQIAKVGIGIVLLLMLFGAELGRAPGGGVGDR